MELFQRLDEDIANLIIGHSLLNLDNLRFATDDEVQNAATLALQMTDPDIQLAIAMQQSIAVDRQSSNGNNNQNDPQQPGSRRYIHWEERNRLLAESRPTSAASSAADENEDRGPGCIVCTGGRQPKTCLPCGCWMCSRCLRACIRTGLRPGNWPPRCCEPLHQEQIEQADRDRPGLLSLYEQIRVENETSGDERVYCARPACAAFIPSRGPHVREDEMECPACGEGTCQRCTQPIHPGRPCRIEDEDEMLMDAMDEYRLSPCPRCRRIIELAAGCHHMTCPCGYEFCFQCGSAWRGRCTRGCALFPQEGQDRRVPVRERDERYRQGQDPDGFPAVVQPEGVPHLEPPPQPLLLPQQQPMPLPEAGLFHPQANDGLWEPMPLELLQGLPLQGFQAMEWPDVEDMNREDRNRQDRGRYSIVMYYTDGSNTEPETRLWRADPRAHRRRPEEGARAWPIFEIHPEDPLCNHHLPTSWDVEDMNNRPRPPQCVFCRSRDEAVYFRCRTCGVVACSTHNNIRFGLTWVQAVMMRQRLESRVWLEEPRRRRGWFRHALRLWQV